MSVNIRPTKLFRVKDEGELVYIFPDIGPPRPLLPGTLVWCHSNRKNSINGYLGHFSFVYKQVYGYSPKPGPEWHMSMEHVEPVQ